MIKKACFFVASLLLSGCATHSSQLELPTESYSEGLRLMVKTNIIKPNQAEKLSVSARNIDLVDEAFDNTAQDAVITMIGTGSSPSTFLDEAGVAATADFLLEAFSGAGLERDPLTYTRFIYTGENGIDGFTAAMKGICESSRDYIEKHFPEKTLQEKTEYIQPALFILDEFMCFIEPGAAALVNIPNVGKIGENMVGNNDFSEYQDWFHIESASFEQMTDILALVSSANPDILIFRGVNPESLEAGKPCQGGHFIRGGKSIAIPELGCSAKFQSLGLDH